MPSGSTSLPMPSPGMTAMRCFMAPPPVGSIRDSIGGCYADAAVSAVELVIANRLDELAAVAARLDALAAAQAVPRGAVADMQVSLDEALSNVIRNAWADAGPHQIRVRLDVGRRRLVAEIEDDGTPFDPLAAPPPVLGAPLRERRVGGLGIHFVTRLMSRVSYARLDNRNRLVLERDVADGEEEAGRGAQ